MQNIIKKLKQTIFYEFFLFHKIINNHWNIKKKVKSSSIIKYTIKNYNYNGFTDYY